jgi:hypothetical protein
VAVACGTLRADGSATSMAGGRETVSPVLAEREAQSLVIAPGEERETIRCAVLLSPGILGTVALLMRR